MLGSVQDAEDVLQETLLRAWRGAAGLRDEAAARGWLYRIATNACLTELKRRQRRAIPHDYGPAAEPGTPPGEPISEVAWLEPYPDEAVGLRNARSSPEAVFDQHEAVELAFVAALQHLGARQRAVLLLRDVLGFSAQEAASILETTVASANSALQRARTAVATRAPQRTQQSTLRTLGDRGLQELVGRYVEAWERCDVDAFVDLLVADASFAMPPLATWYTPRDSIARWAREFSLSGQWRWRAVFVRANAQPALGFYAHDEAAGTHLPFALNVLTLEGERVRDVTAFIVRSIAAPEPEAYTHFPEQPMNPERLALTFGRFGLPDSLD